MTDSEAIRVLLAKDAIRDKLYIYCRSVDRLDKEAGYSVFAEESTADYSDAYRGSGRGAIDTIIDMHRAFSYTSHQITNIIIKVEGNQATSETYCTACVEMAAPDSTLIELIPRVRYLDEWECLDGDWLIVKRVVAGDILYTHTLDGQPQRYNSSRNE
jgi:hypothetical protein